MNSGLRHLAGGHGELGVPAAAQAAGVAIDGAVVGRIGEDHLGQIAVHQASDGIGIPCVPTQQPVAAKAPEVAEAAHRRRLRLERRHLVGSRVVAFAGRTLDQKVDLGRGKAGHRQIEAELEAGQLGQLQRQQLAIPAGQLGQPVIGQHIGALLGLAHIGKPDRRHLIHTEQPGGCDSAMAGEDPAGLVDQDGVGEAEGADAVGDLPDLALGMGARIARVGRQAGEGPRFDVQVRHRRS